MPFAIPPFLRGAFEVFRSWHFYAIAATLTAIGVALQQFNPDQRSVVCEAYHARVAPSIERELDQQLALVGAGGKGSSATAATTQPATGPTTASGLISQSDAASVKLVLMRAVDGYFCPRST